MYHYGDGIRRCHSSPAESNGGIDEPGQKCGHDDSNRRNSLESV